MGSQPICSCDANTIFVFRNFIDILVMKKNDKFSTSWGKSLVLYRQNLAIGALKSEKIKNWFFFVFSTQWKTHLQTSHKTRRIFLFFYFVKEKWIYSSIGPEIKLVVACFWQMRRRFDFQLKSPVLGRYFDLSSFSSFLLAVCPRESQIFRSIFSPWKVSLSNRDR